MPVATEVLEQVSLEIRICISEENPSIKPTSCLTSPDLSNTIARPLSERPRCQWSLATGEVTNQPI